jgi:hypothetical protein
MCQIVIPNFGEFQSLPLYQLGKKTTPYLIITRDFLPIITSPPNDNKERGECEKRTGGIAPQNVIGSFDQ